RQREGGMPAGEDESGRSALHPLYVGLDRQAEGRAAHTGGYLVYASMTHEYVFDYHHGDIYWCTADVGWVT
ncbi:acetyl-CoA synthetase, partial [Rhizobium sp. Pop5]